MIYWFEDCDIDGFTELDISGDDYKTLINHCYKYCKYFTFTSYKHTKNIVMNAPIKEKECRDHFWNPGRFGEVFIYECNQVNKDYLLTTVNSVFDWTNYGTPYSFPEDLTFYREDGSLFFYSEAHEGNCLLFPREAEDISLVLNQYGWRESETLPECPFLTMPDKDYNLFAQKNYMPEKRYECEKTS